MLGVWRRGGGSGSTTVLIPPSQAHWYTVLGSILRSVLQVNHMDRVHHKTLHKSPFNCDSVYGVLPEQEARYLAYIKYRDCPFKTFNTLKLLMILKQQIHQTARNMYKQVEANKEAPKTAASGTIPTCLPLFNLRGVSSVGWVISY